MDTIGGGQIVTSKLYTLADFFKRALNIVFFMRDEEQLLGAFWFIRALFIAALTVATFHYVFKKWAFFNRYVAFFILFCLSYLTTHYNFSIPILGRIGLILFSATFYVAGYCYKAMECKWFYTKTCLFITTLITFAGLVYFNKVTGVLGIHSKDIFPYSIVALSGIIMILNISKLLEATSIKKLLYFIGNNTMVVLALHFTCFKFVSLLKIAIYHWPIERLAEFPVIEQNNTFYWILYTTIGIILPIAIQALYNSIYAKKHC